MVIFKKVLNCCNVMIHYFSPSLYQYHQFLREPSRGQLLVVYKLRKIILNKRFNGLHTFIVFLSNKNTL